jgi:hypothetical protein
MFQIVLRELQKSRFARNVSVCETRAKQILLMKFFRESCKNLLLEASLAFLDNVKKGFRVNPMVKMQKYETNRLPFLLNTEVELSKLKCSAAMLKALKTFTALL